MKRKLMFILLAVALYSIGMASDSSSGFQKTKLKETTIQYRIDGETFTGFVVYDASLSDKRPAVLVIPEWWGLNDYPKMRARELARLGYIAMAVDMYGDGKVAADPKEAQALASAFYKDPSLGKIRLEAAQTKLKEFSETDPLRMAAIGYCFGGSVVLNSAKLGANLLGVVSFHGGLAGVPASKDLLKAKILVCHGASDQFVPQKDVETFRHQLDSIKAPYIFKTYPNATHAFTNPASTETGKKFNMPIAYNPEADKASWEEMKTFLAGIFNP